MDYLGVCLSSRHGGSIGLPGDDGLPAPIVDARVAFPGGCVGRVAFSADGRSLWASGSNRPGIQSWRVLDALTPSEKKSLHDAEAARLRDTQANAAGLSAAREADRIARFTKAESEKSRQFAAEMDKLRERERAEIAQEAGDIDADGEDLLLGSAGSAAAAAAPGGSQTERKRRPSEAVSASPSTSTGFHSARRPSEAAMPTSILSKPGHSGATKGGGSIGWLDQVGEQQEEESKSDHSLASGSTKFPALKSNNANGATPTLPSLRRQLSRMSLAAGASASGGGAASSRPAASASAASVAAGSSTARPAAASSATDEFVTPRKAGEKDKTKSSGKKKKSNAAASTSSSAATAASTAPVDDSAVSSPLASARRSFNRRKTRNIDGEDDVAEAFRIVHTTLGPATAAAAAAVTTVSPASAAAASSSQSLESPTGSSSSRRTALRMSSRRSAHGNSPRDGNSADTSRSASGRASPTNSSSHALYSDFDPDSLAHKLRVPSCPRPGLARILPPEPALFADLHPGALWALSADETMLVHLRMYEQSQAQAQAASAAAASSAAAAASASRRIAFFDRIKGREVSCSEKPLSSSAGAPSSISLSEDGRRVLVATRAGHIYSQNPSVGKWQYVWLKVNEADDPTTIFDAQLSPDGLTVVVARAPASTAAAGTGSAAPLSLWNTKSNKLLAMLTGVAAAAGSSAASIAPQAQSAPGHIGSPLVSVAWLADSESLVSVNWGIEDRTCRLWRGVVRAGSMARSLLLGRLNTPFTHWTPRADADLVHPRALAVSPNGKVLALALGCTLFIFSLVTCKCTQYLTLPDLFSVAESEADQVVGQAEWRDPYALHAQALSAPGVVHAHASLPGLSPPIDPELLAMEKAACTIVPPGAAATATAATSNGGPPTLGRQKSQTGIGGSSAALPAATPALNKRSSLVRGDGLLPSLAPTLSKRGSMARDGSSAFQLSSPSSASNNNLSSPPSISKRASMRGMNDGAGSAVINLQLPSGKKGSMGRSGGAASGSLLSPDVPPLVAPAGLTPLSTYVCSLAFHPSGAFLAVGSSIGALVVLELSRSVLRGEEERALTDQHLWPARRRTQRAAALATAAEDAKYAEAERARAASALAAEQAREAARSLYADRQAVRDSRRSAREEARRLKLYAGSLPDLSYAPSPAKVIALDSLRPAAHAAALDRAVGVRGADFLSRLDSDLADRDRKLREREERRAAELAAELAAAAKLHASGASTRVVKAKQSSFLARLNRDLDKRAGFRSIADQGQFYDSIGDERYKKKAPLKAIPMPQMSLPPVTPLKAASTHSDR